MPEMQISTAPFSPAEGALAEMHRFIESKEFASVEEANAAMQEWLQDGKGVLTPTRELTDAERAQELVYEAWDCPLSKRTKLAKQALASRSQKRCLELLDQAVDAAARSLPKGCFEDPEWVGHFWSILETRPYMRARQMRGLHHWCAGDPDLAIEDYLELLRLNPNDHQGLRYEAIAWLLAVGGDALAGRILDQYVDDTSATLTYERALYEFKRHGPGARARKRLVKAFSANPYVLVSLMFEEELPCPATYAPGEPSEGIFAANILDVPLQCIPGALEWMATTLREAMAKGQVPGLRL